MIQMRTILNVADNTGAKKIACIKMLGGSTAGRYGRRRRQPKRLSLHLIAVSVCCAPWPSHP